MKEMEARVKMLEDILGQMQSAFSAVNNELFQCNANAIALFRALEEKKILTEDDIKESWQKNVVDPYEEGQESEDKAGEVAEDTEPTTETPTN